MNEKESSTTTLTKESEIKTEINDDLVSAKSATFLMFAELMGYTSPLIEWANDMCDGKMVKPFMEKFIKIDAINIFKQMCVDLKKETIRLNWFAFYDTVLEDYERNVKKVETDELPF